jgi:ankyrin repeat protein
MTINLIEALKNKTRIEVKAILRTLTTAQIQSDETARALIAHIQLGNLDAAFALVEAGANLSFKDEHEHAPLFYACERPMYPLVKLIIQRSTDGAEQFYNPHQIAIILDNPSVSINPASAAEDFKLAIDFDSHVVANRLLDHIEIGHIMAQEIESFGDPVFIDKVLELRPDLIEQVPNDTALNFAIYMGYEPLVDKLLRKPDIAFDRSAFGYVSTILVAISNNHFGIAKKLVQDGRASIHAVNDKGEAIINLVAKSG